MSRRRQHPSPGREPLRSMPAVPIPVLTTRDFWIGLPWTAGSLRRAIGFYKIPLPFSAAIAQPVEQLTCNEKVQGSIPCGGTTAPRLARVGCAAERGLCSNGLASWNRRLKRLNVDMVRVAARTVAEWNTASCVCSRGCECMACFAFWKAGIGPAMEAKQRNR